MSGFTKQKLGGLEVVKISAEPGRPYELDEEALASVLLRPEVRSLPVAVVSVAGAYRGGKSFILDFFLRYLKAPREHQRSTQWLGKEDDLLEGFDWRGGGESNTKGIHLWPEPIIVTSERTGEKVAVLLMDTQGTFDTESDMGDNSTIFALSTLLSSVQIYNLRANIGEDDLQHLQLFTEYGKLACGNEGKAFQTLLFLVRDWMSAYEHPHGFAGGQALMNKKLAPKPKQKKQLREVRDHIHSCFEKLQCFLMPHPGLTVADVQFKGRLCDLNEQFRLALLELVPALFDPNNLILKTINGDKVQAQGLLEFFKQYVTIFNSDDIPEATTIYQATADACVMSALREARERYQSKMVSNIVEDQSVTTNIIHDWHNAAVTSALNHFQGKKKLGSPDNVETHLADLRKELEARLSLYIWQNDAKVRDTLSEATKAYEVPVAAVCKGAGICLHVRDLQALHLEAFRAALAVFDRTRSRVQQEQDEERKVLIENLEKHYGSLGTVNAQNNRSATLKARELYLSQMRDGVNQRGVSSDELKKQHEKALKAAIRHLQSLRNRPTQETNDPDVEALETEIEKYFGDFEKSNAHSNLTAMQVAEFTYNNFMTSSWGPPSCCFHPLALKELHNEGRKRAEQHFLNDRLKSAHDDYMDKLMENLADRYEEYVRINEFNNDQAIDQAYSEYTRRMDKHSQPGLSSILIAPFLVKTFALLPKYHEKCKKIALNSFNERRRGGSYGDDDYLSCLEKKLDKAYANYKNPLQAVIREVGAQHVLTPRKTYRELK